jgi:precorrin-2 dehydrogenase/sirohydrochlorin ferrochelatase
MTLLECGAIVTVVSPDVAEELLELAEKKMIELKKRPYEPSDIDGIFLVIGATDNEKLNWQINKDAERQNKLCNIADRPEACNFILPSIVNRGNLVIAISTSGKSPAFAKKMRQDLEKEFGEEYDEFLQLMGAIRKKALSEKHEPEAHKHLFEQLINRGLIDMIRNHDEERINSLLLEIFGEGYRFKKLMKTAS